MKIVLKLLHLCEFEQNDARTSQDSCELMVRAGLFSGITIYYYYNRKIPNT